MMESNREEEENMFPGFPNNSPLEDEEGTSSSSSTAAPTSLPPTPTTTPPTPPPTSPTPDPIAQAPTTNSPTSALAPATAAPPPSTPLPAPPPPATPPPATLPLAATPLATPTAAPPATIAPATPTTTAALDSSVPPAAPAPAEVTAIISRPEEGEQQQPPLVQPEPVEEFSWDDYLEETSTEAVPPSAFQHVEKSLESGVCVGHLVEVVPLSPAPPGYWLARVITTCGPLLRLSYIAQSCINVECWREVAQGGLHPVGWCSSHSIPLTPPSELTEHLLDEQAKEEAVKAVEEAQKSGISVCEDALDVEEYTAIDRIKCGMKLEVLWEGDPLSGWVATVADNIGGRLLLRYDTPDNSSQTFWLFYQHPRLRPSDWLHTQGTTHRYSNPVSSLPYDDAEWAAFLELSRDGARHSAVPDSLLTQTSLPTPHVMAEGMLLEAVHPFRPFTVHACRVSEVIDSHYFKVTLESNIEEFSWTTYIGDPLVLPCGYCKQFGFSLVPPREWEGDGEFEWSVYAGETIEPFLTTPDMFSEHPLAEDLGFAPGQKLEVVSVADQSQICAATVKQVGGHLVMVQLDSEKDSTPILHSADSQDLFPTGWCQANNYPLQLPIEYIPRPVQPQLSQAEPSQASDTSDNTTTTKSLWCPRLYVNHWCYTGPYLSKTKVAKQSQSVGPGSVELVLREVISMTINAAYIPTRVLRELERNGPNPSTVSPSWLSTPFKAKFKRYSCTTNLYIPTTANDVHDFLHSICRLLQCCPNLWSTVPSGENCPLLCTSQMLLQGCPPTGMRGRGRIAVIRSVRGFPGVTRVVYRRKRGGRKRLYVPVRSRLLPSKSLTPVSVEAMEEAEEEEEGEIEEVEDYDVGSGSDGDTSSRSSRQTSPLPESGSGQAAKRQRKGLKLTEYSTQVKARQKRKFEGQDVTSANLGFREEVSERREPVKRSRKSDLSSSSSGLLEPATVTSDPMEWTVTDVEEYVAGQPAICQHAVKLRQEEVDGRAFLLLNLPTLVQHLGLPHSSAVSLAQHICRVKLAHFLYFKPEP